MKKIRIALASLVILGLVSCKNEGAKDNANEGTTEDLEKVEESTQQQKATIPTNSKKIQFKLEPKSGSTAEGKVEIAENEGIVYFSAELIGLSEGTHAIHIHEKADCSSDDGKSSGGHWNPTFQNHGKWETKGGFHLGDIGNFEVDSNGNAKINMSTNLWCIGCGDEKKDILGKALVVHQGADDFVSQPSGAAGARVSCAAIIE